MEKSCTKCGEPLALDSSRVVMELYVHGNLERIGEYCPECATPTLRRWRETDWRNR